MPIFILYVPLYIFETHSHFPCNTSPSKLPSKCPFLISLSEGVFTSSGLSSFTDVIPQVISTKEKHSYYQIQCENPLNHLHY